MVKRALEGAAITGSGFQCRQCRTLIVARSRRDRIPARPGSRGASHRSGAGPGTVDDQSGGDQKPNHWPVCALARAGADLGKGSPAKSPEAGRVSVTGTGHRDAHRSVQPGTGCGSTESRASGESGDAGVTRDDLPGTLRSRSWIVALGSCHRVAVRAGNTATAEAGGSHQRPEGPGSSRTLPPSSTAGPAHATATERPQKSSPHQSRIEQIKPVLHTPPEFAARVNRDHAEARRADTVTRRGTIPRLRWRNGDAR